MLQQRKVDPGVLPKHLAMTACRSTYLPRASCGQSKAIKGPRAAVWPARVGVHVNSSQLTSLCHDYVSLFISFNKNILTTFQPVTLAFIRFEVIHKFKNQNNKQSQCK